MSAALKFDMTGFNQQVGQVRSLIHRNARSYVRTTARRLIKRLAYNAPRAPAGYAASGRLRAGFWAAAIKLGITNIYTNQVDRGEGSAIDATNAKSPSFTITNSVPYLGNLKDGLAWAETARRGVEAQMARDLEKYARDSWEKRSLVEDLTGG